MKNLFLLCLCLFIAAQSTNAQSADNEIIDVRDDILSYVRVTQNQAKAFKFEFCATRYTENCQLIGKRDNYTLQELRKLRQDLRATAFYTTAGEVAAFAIAGATAVTLAVHASNASANLARRLGGAAVGAFGGAGLGLTVVTLGEKLNLAKAYRKANVLREDVLDGSFVEIENISQFANDLNEVLGTI